MKTGCRVRNCMTGGNSKSRTLGEFLWGGVIELKAKRPKPGAAGKTVTTARPPLLRYPPGKAPAERGICRAER